MTDHQQEQGFTEIDLSQDELAFILTLFSLNEISGFGVPPDFDEAAASAAADSLTARGLAVEAEGGQTIHPDIKALVTLGALYHVALGINIQRGGAAPNRYWFYFAPDRAVYHHKPRLGVERFEAIPTREAFAATFSRLLKLDSQSTKAGYGVLSIPKMLLAQAETVKAKDGLQAASQMLVAKNIPEAFAARVLDEDSQIILVTIRVTESASGDVRAETNTHMLIAAKPGYWLLQEDTSDPESIAAHPADSTAALDFVMQLTVL